MAFTPKTWVGRSVEHPGRINLVSTGTENQFDVERAEGEVYNDGDLVSDAGLNDLEQRILDAFAGKADGTGGAANNALALGGVAAANYVQNVSSATTNLTKINGWTGGNVRLSTFGKAITVGIGGGSISGTQNTFIAMLPSNIKSSTGWIINSNGLYIRDDGSGNYGLYSNLATVASENYIVFISQ